MAAKRDYKSDKEYLLNLALKFLKEAYDEEEAHLERASENSHYVLSTLLDDIHINKKSG